MKKSDIELLSKLQRLFLSSLLGVKNCPAVMMLWDLGMISIPMRILKEKLLLYHHIKSLPTGAVARQVIDIQENLNFPSLRNDISFFLAKFCVVDVTEFTKET